MTTVRPNLLVSLQRTARSLGVLLPLALLGASGVPERTIPAFPHYNVRHVCAEELLRRQPEPDCQATERAFEWALRRTWPHLQGLERMQLLNCLDAVETARPDTGSYSALAECAASVSNIDE